MEREERALKAKNVFEKIKPKLIKKHGEIILKHVFLQEHIIFVDLNCENFKNYFLTLKKELKKEFINIPTNQPTECIPLFFEKTEIK